MCDSYRRADWRDFRSFALKRHAILDVYAQRDEQNQLTADERSMLNRMASTLGKCAFIWWSDGKPRRIVETAKQLALRAREIADGHPDPGRPPGFSRRRSRRSENPVATEWDVIRSIVSPFVFARDNHECVTCRGADRLTVDHILPVGHPLSSNRPENLRTLCQSCNSRKGAKVE